MGYENGKIYKLWSNETDEIYIGSTTNPLCKRLYQHKTDYKIGKNGKRGITSAYKLFEKGGDVMIELIEKFPCECKEELNAREGFYIRQEKCVNRCIAGRTRKEYREDTADKMKEYWKEYKEENRDAISAKQKEWKEENREKVLQYYKEYRQENREALSEKARERVMCECGAELSRCSLSRHLKGNRHKKLMELKI